MEKTSGDASYQYVSLANKNTPVQVYKLKDVMCWPNDAVGLKVLDRAIEELEQPLTYALPQVYS